MDKPNNLNIKGSKEGDPIPEIDLSNLSATHFGKKIRVKFIITGQSNPKNFPKKAILRCSKCGESEIDLSLEGNVIHLRNYIFDRLKFEANMRKSDACVGASKQVVYSDERVDYFEIYAMDLLGEKRFEESTYRTLKLYLLGRRVPAVKKVEAMGYVVDDYAHNLTLFIYDIKPIEETEGVTFTDEDYENFVKYFANNNNLREAIDRTINPYIKGRAKAKLVAALTLHSPLRIRFEGQECRGTLKTMFLGDTTTGKSKILEWIRDYLRIGEWGVGESSKRTGILFTVDPEERIIIWGLLVSADKGLALIDSLQGMNPEEIPHLREALREERVTVRMSVSGEAMCRARILAAANPQRLSLDQYMDYAEALLDIRCIKDPVDLTRWDMFVRFSASDVPIEDIARSEYSEPYIPIEVFRKHVLWAWSLKPEDIIFTEQAIERIRRAFVELNEFSHPSIPLIHRGYKEVLARIACAFAILHHSSPDNRRVEVKPSHVEKAIELVQEMMEDWQYELYTARLNKLNQLSDEEYLRIKSALQRDAILYRTFEAIKEKQGVGTMELASKLAVSKQTIITKAAQLKAEGLIEAHQRRKGYWLSPKGTAFWRRYLQESGELVKTGQPTITFQQPTLPDLTSLPESKTPLLRD
jgi:DNA replicative helicase MCM subunit Mcm2 (Cdc46/Mcm family)